MNNTSPIATLLSHMNQLDPSQLRQLEMMTAVIAPHYASSINPLLQGQEGASGAEQQMKSLEDLYNEAGGGQGGMLGGLLQNVKGTLFGGPARAYLQARASAANTLANATGQDPNAVLAGLPTFSYSPGAASSAFRTMQAPLGQPFSGSVLSGLPQPSASVGPLPPVR